MQRHRQQICVLSSKGTWQFAMHLCYHLSLQPGKQQPMSLGHWAGLQHPVRGPPAWTQQVALGRWQAPNTPKQYLDNFSFCRSCITTQKLSVIPLFIWNKIFFSNVALVAQGAVVSSSKLLLSMVWFNPSWQRSTSQPLTPASISKTGGRLEKQK